MKIVHIVPGSGDSFYCQNCMRDRDLLRALQAQGHDVILVPMYLPLFSEGTEMTAQSPLFYGAVRVYIEQYLPWLARAPRWLKALLDSRRLLRWIALKASSTRAQGLEGMTLSVLNGEQGGQKEELDRLVRWLADECRPDILHISNALLLGLAGRIHRELGIPVVCTLQDEDTWIDTMEPWATQEAWAIMSKRCADIAAFVPVSQYYSEIMQRRLGIAAQRMHVIPIGIDTRDYGQAQPSPDAPIIGFLSRMSETLGLHTLVDAFVLLRARPGLARVRLGVMGGKSSDDRAFLAQLRERLRAAGLEEEVTFHDAFDRQSRIAFLQTLSMLSVPIPQAEAFGVYAIEALACGVPIVQPRLGAVPELLAATGGGMCYEPNDAATLASSLEGLLRDPARAQQLGLAGREVVHRSFDVGQMAERVVEVYRQCLQHEASPSKP